MYAAPLCYCLQQINLYSYVVIYQWEWAQFCIKTVQLLTHFRIFRWIWVWFSPENTHALVLFRKHLWRFGHAAYFTCNRANKWLHTIILTHKRDIFYTYAIYCTQTHVSTRILLTLWICRRLEGMCWLFWMQTC